jgi:hypothetical protein
MRGDFTRDTFDPTKHFSRVLKQQGRVTLDADDNEQTSILLHYLRTLTRDLLGPFAVPGGTGGFAIANDGDGGLTLSKGHCYVDGILVENDDPPPADSALSKAIKESDQTFWLYLDVWESLVTALEDESIREMALGGPDTCTRAKVMWRVRWLEVAAGFDEAIKALPDPQSGVDKARVAQLKAQQKQLEDFRKDPVANKELIPDLCAAPLTLLGQDNPPMLTARLDPGKRDHDPCSIMSPESRYRGLENQLYRVEIHHGSEAYPPTFKWSRDNGSVVTTSSGSEDHALQVVSARGLAAKSWVEVSDAALEQEGAVGVLMKVIGVEGDNLSLDGDLPPGLKSAAVLKVRRWDQPEEATGPDGEVPIKEGATDGDWIPLENGIQVRFAEGGEYRPGDYWLIPARVAGGTIEWPEGKAQKPHGVEHHYAPLGLVWWDGDDYVINRCACEILPVSDCTAASAKLTGAVAPKTAKGARPPSRSPAKRAVGGATK